MLIQLTYASRASRVISTDDLDGILQAKGGTSFQNGDDQILIPPSFEALYRDARGRLTLTREDFRQRYELCEDMAQMLTEPSQGRLHEMGLSEDLILARTRDGLCAGEGAAFSADEAAWIATRLAELLGWDWAEALPAPGAAQR